MTLIRHKLFIAFITNSLKSPNTMTKEVTIDIIDREIAIVNRSRPLEARGAGVQFKKNI